MCFVRHWVDSTLEPIQRLVMTEGTTAQWIHFFRCNKPLRAAEWHRLTAWN